jgi:hypothetical protein
LRVYHSSHWNMVHDSSDLTWGTFTLGHRVSLPTPSIRCSTILHIFPTACLSIPLWSSSKLLSMNSKKSGVNWIQHQIFNELIWSVNLLPPLSTSFTCKQQLSRTLEEMMMASSWGGLSKSSISCILFPFVMYSWGVSLCMHEFFVPITFYPMTFPEVGDHMELSHRLLALLPTGGSVSANRSQVQVRILVQAPSRFRWCQKLARGL